MPITPSPSLITGSQMRQGLRVGLPLPVLMIDGCPQFVPLIFFGHVCDITTPPPLMRQEDKIPRNGVVSCSTRTVTLLTILSSLLA